MAEKKYAVVGSWFYRPGPKGVSLLEYHPEDGSLTFLETKFRGINADAMCLDSERGIAYFADACATPRGGRVAAVKIDTKSQDMEVICERDTLFRDPNYIWIDSRDKKHAFVSHHSNTVLVNKLRRQGDGTFDVEALYDDVGLVVFRVEEDGTFGGICDVALTSTDERVEGGHGYSRQHSVVGSPCGKLLIVSDKGLDWLYTFSFDREREKLTRLGEYRLSEPTAPRYGLFHPELPIYYCSCEKKLAVMSFGYDAETGRLELLGETPLSGEEFAAAHRPEKRIESGDIKMNPEKSCIYVTIRGLEQIAVLRMEVDGSLKLIQSVGCGGENPRCLCISPDKRFLLCGNMESQTIRTLEILEDGTLKLTEREVSVPLPSCIEIL